ncbi:hypothetical protein ASPWEDRAFT_505210 [Aspergillus wentii DTO 134E9]|uniref:Uncharacterized protein n=1 Tax=Aspergillus wentii DTO 134E9 TaxID=1073089 RepID=A0A1L9RK42_ASPWE|nr:uncharacterized protein ASPWEDRAFT_505210 [Aspergillus wentii DTO 134E9]OJJ35302.1 hypothetical protein ASPWEDRAFT_505210 [Aspergillus wentii DTO 134E9]
MCEIILSPYRDRSLDDDETIEASELLGSACVNSIHLNRLSHCRFKPVSTCDISIQQYLSNEQVTRNAYIKHDIAVPLPKLQAISLFIPLYLELWVSKAANIDVGRFSHDRYPSTSINKLEALGEMSPVKYQQYVDQSAIRPQLKPGPRQ